ncbi:MAG: hypothetical protein Q8O13_11230 [Candidatus Omnitrophota bacterium]|nr:hypothetical protein [Candidatus Omnitrophota bacterium]
MWEKRVSGKRLIKAQVTIEFTFCLVIVVLLFIASFYALIWGVDILVVRTTNYEASMIGGRDQVVKEDFYITPPMSIIPLINRE